MHVAIAAVTVLVVGAVALDTLSAEQLMQTIGDGETGQLRYATRILFVIGLLVSALQVHILLARSIRDRDKELSALAAIGVPRSSVSLAMTIEYLGHTTIGTLFGLFISGCVVLGDSVSFGVLRQVDAAHWLAAFAIAGSVPLIASLPLSAFMAARFNGTNRSEMKE